MTGRVAGAPAALEVHVTGRRILATVVDGLVLAVLFAVVSMLFGTTTVEGSSVNASLGAFGTILYLALVIAYYVVLEGYLGQTLGKMLLGIKVVREADGQVPGIKAAAIRTVLRIVDGFASYLVAFIAVLASSKNQRLGDMAAHTLVVRK